MRNLVLMSLLLGASSATLWADFSYEETTQMTGGSMMSTMRALGPLAGRATEPTVATHIVKGNRMATVRRDSTTIIDLDKETITTIDNAKKSYSVVTFAEMKQRMDEAIQRMQNRKGTNGNEDVKADFKISAKATGKTKTVQGLNAKEMLITTVMEGTDVKSGQSGGMNMESDAWYAPLPGYGEVREFQKKMAMKMGAMFGSGMQQIAMMNAGQANFSKGMEEVAKEMQKIDGVPVETVIRVSLAASAPASSETCSAEPQTSAKPQSQESTAGAIAGALTGRLGGFGGLGRRKKNEDEQPKEQPKATASSNSQGCNASAALMEMTMTLNSFSSAPADPSKFEIPSGYKQVDARGAR